MTGCGLMGTAGHYSELIRPQLQPPPRHNVVLRDVVQRQT